MILVQDTVSAQSFQFLKGSIQASAHFVEFLKQAKFQFLKGSIQA